VLIALPWTIYSRNLWAALTIPIIWRWLVIVAMSVITIAQLPSIHSLKLLNRYLILGSKVGEIILSGVPMG
jgi:hypothetical protein